MKNNFLKIFGAFLVLFGGVMLYLGIRDAQVCTYPSTGVIVDYHIDESYNSTNHTTTISYFPIVKYTYEGKEYTTQSSYGDGSKEEIGTEINILINPDDPQQFIEEGESTPIIGAIVTTLGLGIIVFDIISKSKKKTAKTNCAPEDFHLS